MTRAERIYDFLRDVNPEALLADGLEEALVGTTTGMYPLRGPVAVYDRQRCVEVFMRKGMNEEEADEWMSYSVEGAFVGEGTPVFVDFRDFE